MRKSVLLFSNLCNLCVTQINFNFASFAKFGETAKTSQKNEAFIETDLKILYNNILYNASVKSCVD